MAAFLRVGAQGLLQPLLLAQVPQVYPSMFVLVVKVLDTFGRLVYERIKRRSQFDEKTGRPIQTLPEPFRALDIPPEAKEMCKNWFFKVAAIREVLCSGLGSLCGRGVASRACGVHGLPFQTSPHQILDCG